MTARSTEHATFEIDRIYRGSPARVFGAWADPAAKARWFGPTESDEKREFDFRVGGREHFATLLPDGRLFGYDGRYHEIVPDHRIIYAYTIDFDQTRISTSLVTVVITEEVESSRLIYTEQAVYLDGGDTPTEREHGTRKELDNLGAVLS